MAKGNFYLNKNENDFTPSGKKHHRLRLAVFTMLVVFLISVGIFYYSEDPLTGYAIKSFNETEYVPFSAEIGVPDSIVSKGSYGLVEFEADNIFLSVNRQDFDLTNSRRNLIGISNFSGKLNFNSESFNLLEGKSSDIIINGVLNSYEDNVKVNAIGDFDYSYLKIEGNFYIDKLDYETSGILNFGDSNHLALRGDNVTINEFIGDLEIKDGKMFLKGYVKSIDIEGAQRISVEA